MYPLSLITTIGEDPKNSAYGLFVLAHVVRAFSATYEPYDNAHPRKSRLRMAFLSFFFFSDSLGQVYASNTLFNYLSFREVDLVLSK